VSTRLPSEQVLTCSMTAGSNKLSPTTFSANVGQCYGYTVARRMSVSRLFDLRTEASSFVRNSVNQLVNSTLDRPSAQPATPPSRYTTRPPSDHRGSRLPSRIRSLESKPDSCQWISSTPPRLGHKSGSQFRRAPAHNHRE